MIASYSHILLPQRHTYIMHANMCVCYIKDILQDMHAAILCPAYIVPGTHSAMCVFSRRQYTLKPWSHPITVMNVVDRSGG